ncbi:MAG: alpha/beta fold hydrolase [Bacteroidota bacterium]
MKEVTLFCLPFAGGSRYSYRELAKLATHNIQVTPIEIPGRGSRINEPLLDDCISVVDDIFHQIKDELDTPYAIYGHSMGTLLGYVLVQRILQEQVRRPICLFFSGGPGPSSRGYRPDYHDLPADQFFEKIKQLGGIPDEIAKDRKLLAYFEPVLRADFKVTETYNYIQTRPFDIPIVVMIGTEEDITKEQALSWQLETTYELEFYQFQGGHFFLYDHTFNIMKLISSRLTQRLYAI